MSVRTGRVVSRSVPMEPVVIATPIGGRAGPAQGRVVRKQVVDRALEAQEMVTRARAEAAALLESARAQRESLLAQAYREGLDAATAKLAAAWIALRAREAAADRHAEERVIAVARLLAERLLGEALRVDPAIVVALTREAMRQLRRADRLTIEANPDDAGVLRANLAALPVDAELVEIVASPSQARGCVRIVSNLGTLDADLAPQLDRLTDAIRRDLDER